MRILRAFLLVPVLFALLAATASADGRSANSAHLDKHFGVKGVVKIATAEKSAQRRVSIAFGPKGRIYALQGPLLLAFEANGKPAREFGSNGRVRVISPRGGLDPTGLAVDSKGRVLVSGTITNYPYAFDQPIPTDTKVFDPVGVQEAFVDRFLADGIPDSTFGAGGEVDTTFSLPRPTGEPGKAIEFERPVVKATTLAVDPQDRPVIGGTYVSAIYYCAYGDELFASFVGRLTTSGAVDPSYAGKGYATTAAGSVEALAKTPEGGVAMLTSGIPYCAEHSSRPTSLDTLTENGDQIPQLDLARPMGLSSPLLAVDSHGRSVLFQGSYNEEPPILIRLRPNGTLDRTFGFDGGIPLKGDVTEPGAIAVDSSNRTLVAQSWMQHPYGPRVVRYTPAGKRDWKFGQKGLLEGPVVNDVRGGTDAVAIDSKGRIYTAGWVESKTLKTGYGIQITRFVAN